MARKRAPSTQPKFLAAFVASLAWLGLAGCSSLNDVASTRGDGIATCGASGAGSAAATGGAATLTTGGQATAGGAAATGGQATAGGAAATGGQATAGGASATGSGANCEAAATPAATSMNPGTGCTNCHSGSSPSAGVLITLGGTVYSNASAGSAVSGATVTITDANNAVTKLVTGADGNFYTGSTIAYPAKVAVSKCPDTAPMSGTISSGNCNSCHGSSMQIHLP